MDGNSLQVTRLQETYVCACVLFPVSDGEHTSPETALTIHLVPSDRHPPAFRVTAPLLEVSPGGSTSVGKNWEPERNMALGMEP